MQNKTYYSQWPGVKSDDLDLEINQLGKIDYYKNKPKFTPHQGWWILQEFINQNREDILNATKFISSDGKEFKLEKLLNDLQSIEFRK